MPHATGQWCKPTRMRAARRFWQFRRSGGDDGTTGGWNWRAASRRNGAPRPLSRPAATSAHALWRRVTAWTRFKCDLHEYVRTRLCHFRWSRRMCSQALWTWRCTCLDARATIGSASNCSFVRGWTLTIRLRYRFLRPVITLSPASSLPGPHIGWCVAVATIHHPCPVAQRWAA